MASASQVSGSLPQLWCLSPPLFQPGCCSWRPDGIKPQLRGKPSQVSLHVDVVERLCEADGKLQFAGARQQGTKRTLRAHAVAIEKVRMGRLGSDEIVASVMRWSDDHVVRMERLERARKNRRRQMRAVAVEGDDALPARREVRKH